MLTGGLYALQFDLLKDLEPIIQIGSEPLLIVGKKSLPADDLKGLIAWLKANPDKASVGIAGVGATGHLTGISFQKETGTKFQFVPYRGNAPAMQDLLAEQIDFMIEPSSNFKALVRAGSVKPFAVTGKTRLASAPNIPTADEAGLPGFFASLWYGLWVPKDTPKDIIARLNATMIQILADPKVQAALRRARHPDHGRSISNRRKRCALSRRPRPSAGGRSSRPRTSSRSRGRHCERQRSNPDFLRGGRLDRFVAVAPRNDEGSLHRHSGAMRSIELWCAIAHLRIFEIPGSALTGCPGMTEDEAETTRRPSPASAGNGSCAPPAASAYRESSSSSW